jgi:hypothetical protein
MSDTDEAATGHKTSDKQAAILVVEGAISKHDSLLDLVRVRNVLSACELDLIGGSQRLDPSEVTPGKLYRTVYRELLTGTIARLNTELKGLD